MNEEKDRLEDSAAFLDLMSKSERKEWEKNRKGQLGIKTETVEETIKEKKSKKRANRLENDEINQIIADDQPLLPIETDNTVMQDTLKIAVGEVNGKISEEEPRIEEITEADSSSVGNSKLTTIVGFGTILCFAYYIYLSLNSVIDNSTFHLINSIMIIVLMLFFSLSVLCNRRISKTFSVMNLLVIFTFITFNILILINL